MLLANKVAVIYGAGGPIGGAVARAFAREGARVFLAGRIQAKLDKVAEEIRWDGGVADAAVVDALDERAVDEYVNMVAEQAGYLDISYTPPRSMKSSMSPRKWSARASPSRSSSAAPPPAARTPP